MRKYITATILICLTILQINAQKDTIDFYQSRCSLINTIFVTTSYHNGIYKIDNDTVSKSEFERVRLLSDTLDDLTKNVHCRFFVDGVLREECRFYYTMFFGNYKVYYENGNLKMEGQFTDNAIKIGEWKYYRSNGSLKKIRNYKKERWYRNYTPPCTEGEKT